MSITYDICMHNLTYSIFVFFRKKDAQRLLQCLSVSRPKLELEAVGGTVAGFLCDKILGEKLLGFLTKVRLLMTHCPMLSSYFPQRVSSNHLNEIVEKQRDSKDFVVKLPAVLHQINTVSVVGV